MLGDNAFSPTSNDTAENVQHFYDNIMLAQDAGRFDWLTNFSNQLLLESSVISVLMEYYVCVLIKNVMKGGIWQHGANNTERIRISSV